MADRPTNIRTLPSEAIAAGDEAAFSELLAKRFPDARFIDQRETHHVAGPAVDVVLYRRLEECPGTMVDLILNPVDWQPLFRLGESGRWGLSNLPWPYAYYIRSAPQPGGAVHFPKRTEYRPPHIDKASIAVGCKPGDKAQLRTAGQLVRLFASPKLVTRKVDVVSYPDYRLVWRLESHPYLRFGHYALKWAAERPERMLGFRNETKDVPAHGIRPFGEPRDWWEPPAVNDKG